MCFASTARVGCLSGMATCRLEEWLPSLPRLRIRAAIQNPAYRPPGIFRESSAWPGAATLSARGVSGVIAERGGCKAISCALHPARPARQKAGVPAPRTTRGMAGDLSGHKHGGMPRGKRLRGDSDPCCLAYRITLFEITAHRYQTNFLLALSRAPRRAPALVLHCRSSPG
jgi:hypothetical protein